MSSRDDRGEFFDDYGELASIVSDLALCTIPVWCPLCRVYLAQNGDKHRDMCPLTRAREWRLRYCTDPDVDPVGLARKSREPK